MHHSETLKNQKKKKKEAMFKATWEKGLYANQQSD